MNIPSPLYTKPAARFSGSCIGSCITTVLVALEFQHRGKNRTVSRVALLPGAYNPPTVAHLAIARAALSKADEVVFVLPRAFPHKSFEGADFADRCEMLRLAALPEPRLSVAVSDGGLYLEIAEEAAEFFGSGVEIALACGRDAAERITAWDYGRPGVFDGMIDRFPLLVAGRAGEYLPASHHADRITSLDMPQSFDEVSSSEVRRRIEAGEDWRHLVPDAIGDLVSELYLRR